MTATGSEAAMAGATAAGKDNWAENQAFASSTEEAARDSAAERASTQENINRHKSASEASGICEHSFRLLWAIIIQ